MRGLLKPVCVTFAFLLLAACTNAPAKLANSNQYNRLGILPAYEPVVVKRTPPGFVTDARVERLDLDLHVNELMADRVTKMLTGTHEIADLQSFTADYVGAPKVHSSGERKIFGDDRPLFTDVVKAKVGGQGLDAYVVIEGGPLWLYQPQAAAPAVQMATQMFGTPSYDLSLPLSISIIDGQTFQIAAASRADLLQKGVPHDWFVAPNEHADEIKATVVRLLDYKLEPELRKLGLIR